MSIPRPSNLHPDHWVEQQVAVGKRRLDDCRAELESAISRHPLRALAIAAGVGYVARSLPLARVLSSSMRLTLPFVPHLLLTLGAARAWEFLGSDPDRVHKHSRFRVAPNPAADCIAICDKLLRGELSAIESFTQALVKFGGNGERKPLEQILAGHEESASRLRQHIAEMGGDASVSSGIWGDFAKALEGSAAMLGESPALTVLQAGEEHGIHEYEEALNHPCATEKTKLLIRQHLLPRVQDNLITLLRIKAK